MAEGVKVGSIYYDLDIDDQGFLKATPKIKQELSGLEGAFKSAEQGSKMFLGALTALGAAGGAAIGFGVKVAGDLESARQGFVALLGSAEEADAVMARVKKEAAVTPFELTGLVAGAQALTAVTKDGDKAIDTLLDVGKAIATSGKGQAELDRVIMNLQQIASTGKVTAMDIRQFQGAIPMFNDIIEAAGLTQEELMNSSTAAEDLFVAFQKAGAEGGLTALGFEAQAGTFNQLWSNLVDTVTIGMAEFVKASGIFDAVKQALSGVIDALATFTTPENIEKFVNFIVEWGPVITGIIIGGITPALVGMATAFVAMMVPLLPFIAAGAALGFMIQVLIQHLGGWQQAQEKLKAAFDIFVGVYNQHVKPAVDELWSMIKNLLIPELKVLWQQVSPILTPALKILGAIAGGVVIVGLRLMVDMIKDVVQWLTNAVAKVNHFIDVLKSLPELIKNAMNKAGELMDKINPFHKESPSLVQNVTRGIDEILSQYARLGQLQVPAVAGLTDSMMQTNSTQQDITMYIDKVGDQQDISAIGRELGFRAGIMPR